MNFLDEKKKKLIYHFFKIYKTKFDFLNKGSGLLSRTKHQYRTIIRFDLARQMFS